MKGIVKITKWIVGNRYANLIVGIIVMLSGLSEAWATLAEDLKELNLKGHHGLILLGFFNVLKTIPEIFEGLEHFEESEE